MKLTINNKEYKVKLAKTDDEKSEGLRGVKSLNPDEGMLFIFDDPQEVEFEMDDTLIDLDIIFINEDKEIISVEHGKAGEDDDYFTEEDVKYVLEIAPGSKFKPGTQVYFDEGLDIELGQAHILAEDGTVQGYAGEDAIVFSRLNTKNLVKMSNKAKEKDEDKYYEKLGKKVFEYLNIQDSNDLEYVEL